MTSPEKAAELVARAEVVLLDFDGPICAVFAGYRAHEVAAQIMKHAANTGIDLRPADPDDPISVFRATTGMSTEAIAAVQDALVAEESKALSRTAPHPGIPELVHQLRAAGHRLVVVTNNGADPVSEFIEHHDLAHNLEAVVGRDPHRPELLKPAPESITRALVLLDVPADAAVFVGDSITDVLAGQAAGVPVIGFANKPGKDQLLRDAGADAIITAMGDLVPARPLTS